MQFEEQGFDDQDYTMEDLALYDTAQALALKRMMLLQQKY